MLRNRLEDDEGHNIPKTESVVLRIALSSTIGCILA